MPGEGEPQLRAWVDYFRDLGIHDFYRRGEFVPAVGADEVVEIHAAIETAVAESAGSSLEASAALESHSGTIPLAEPMKLISFNSLSPLPAGPVADRVAALVAIREEIGDCTRCPLAY